MEKRKEIEIEKLETKQESMIKKIYYGEWYPLEEIPETEEYKNLMKEILKIEKGIFKRMNKKEKENFSDYIEKNVLKESMEAENQFQLGFKTAVKLLVECIK